MKALLLSKYSSLGASSRLRFHQYAKLFGYAGIELECQSLFNDRYLDAIYSRKRPFALVALLYAQRLGYLMWRLIFGQRVDILIVEKEIFPYLPLRCESMFFWLGKCVVVDYDDAVFHNYDGHPSTFMRWLLGKKIAGVMARADMVISGNHYIAEYATLAGAQRIIEIPTGLDTRKYREQPSEPVGGVTIGWIGTQYTAKYLRLIEEALQAMADEYGARMKLIGPTRSPFRHLAAEVVPWSEASEAQELASIDIGIMPLVDESFERGKCGYKILQYMAGRKAVVASPVGVNSQIVDHGKNGLLASTVAEWKESLRRLVVDASLRAEFGRAGSAKVQRHYDAQIVGGRVVDAVLQCAGSKQRRQLPHGVVIISLDVEMGWGVRERLLRNEYKENVRTEPEVSERLLALFRRYGIRATWALVGALMSESRKELERIKIAHVPSYTSLGRYDYLVGAPKLDEEPDLFFFPRLVKMITEAEGQELATHTFFHYFSEQQGSSEAAFEEDLAAAVAQHELKAGQKPQTIIFPRNQIAPECLDIIPKYGLVCYRGNRSGWLLANKNRAIKRYSNALDALVGLDRSDLFGLDEMGGGPPCNVRESFMFRFLPENGVVKQLILARALRAIRRAARKKKIVHIWWHPHNMGTDMETAFAHLERLLQEVEKLVKQGKLVSLNMSETMSLKKRVDDEAARFEPKLAS